MRGADRNQPFSSLINWSVWITHLKRPSHLVPMDRNIELRNETGADVGAISEVTAAAFKALEISNHIEQFIITALRTAKALAISLVAEIDGRVIGNIAFSPVTISDGTRNWYGPGPVSVLPQYQRQGIGKALAQEGLSRLKASPSTTHSRPMNSNLASRIRQGGSEVTISRGRAFRATSTSNSEEDLL